MKPTVWMILKVQSGSIDDPSATLCNIVAKFDEKAMALPWEQFAECYVRPAFEQLQKEQEFLAAGRS